MPSRNTPIARFWLALVLLIIGRPCLAMSLEQQFAGLADCSMENVYLDASDHQPRARTSANANCSPASWTKPPAIASTTSTTAWQSAR